MALEGTRITRDQRPSWYAILRAPAHKTLMKALGRPDAGEGNGRCR